jgi:hypothetical protein
MCSLFRARRKRCFGFSLRSEVALAGLWLIVSSVVPSNTFGQQSACDPGLLREAAPGALGYADRTDRCEGLYGKYVSTSDPLSLRSFTVARSPLDALPATASVEWPAAQGSVHLFAFALKPRIYYQMDVVLPATARSFAWRTDVAQQVPLSGRDIGIVVYGDDKTVLPARVGTAATLPHNQRESYQVVLWPERTFRAVTRAVRRIAPDGARTIILPNQELGLGFYPDKRAIPIAFPSPDSAGRYELVVLGEFEGAGGVALTIPFVSSGAN